MVNWLHSLSIVSLLLVTCAATALVTVAIYLIVTRLDAAGQRDALTAVSPGLLPPLALVFGLLQFVSTFAIAYFYARHANKSLDPLATELREEFEQEAGR